MDLGFGELANTGEYSCELLDGGVELATAVMEEIARVTGGELLQRLDSIAMQAKVYGHAGLSLPEEQAPVAPQPRALQAGGVADPEPGIEQQQDQGAGALASKAYVPGGCIVQFGDGPKQRGTLRSFKWQSGSPVVARGLDLGGGATADLPAIDGPIEEEPKVLELFSLSAGGDAAPGAEGGNMLGCDAGDGKQSPQKLFELVEGSLVAGERLRGEQAYLAVSEVLGRRVLDPYTLLGARLAYEAIHRRLSLGGISGPETLPHLPPLDLTVDPEGAVAPTVASSLVPMRACLQVATVDGEHGQESYQFPRTPRTRNAKNSSDRSDI